MARFRVGDSVLFHGVNLKIINADATKFIVKNLDDKESTPYFIDVVDIDRKGEVILPTNTKLPELNVVKLRWMSKSWQVSLIKDKGNFPIGGIKWFKQLEEYCFYTTRSITPLSSDCLEEINGIIKSANERRKTE